MVYQYAGGPKAVMVSYFERSVASRAIRFGCGTVVMSERSPRYEPVEPSEKDLKAAFERGRQDFKAYKHNCPYKDVRKAKEWESGYAAAREERTKRS